MMLNQFQAVFSRVLRQLLHDRRFLGLTLIVPLAVVFMLDIFFTAAERPFFDPSTFATSAATYLVHFFTYVLAAIVLVRERTAHTLDRMFVSGYRRGAIIAGYIGAYTVLATIQSLGVLLLLRWLFELDYAFDVFARLYAVIWVLSVISVALGMLVSNFARNEGQVFPFIPLILFPSVFFSGMILPIERLPSYTLPFSYLTPMFYANEAILNLTGKGDSVWLWVIGLPVYGMVVFTLATITLREQI